MQRSTEPIYPNPERNDGSENTACTWCVISCNQDMIAPQNSQEHLTASDKQYKLKILKSLYSSLGQH